MINIIKVIFCKKKEILGIAVNKKNQKYPKRYF
jgi:hypothetical protein